MNLIRIASSLALVCFIAIAGMHSAHAQGDHSEHAKASAVSADAESKGPASAPYPLDTCPVSGAEIDPESAVVRTYEGREVKFCCSGCVGEFEANAAEYIEQIDAQIIAQGVESYPLTTCVVTDAKLGSMGDPVDYVYRNHLVRFCCAGCIDAFEAEPAVYLAKIETARAAAEAETSAE